MSWIDLLTGVDGRINRKPFWITLIVLSIPELAAHVMLDERSNSIVSLLLAYPEFAVFAKRGHDRNVPAWIPALIVAGAAILNVLALFNLIGPTENPNTLFYVIGFPVGIGGLILLVDFGFRRGTAGPNRYGPDPLEAQ